MPAAKPWPESYDTSKDYLYWTNYITIQFLSKTNEQAPPQGWVVINHVKILPINKETLPADSILQKFDQGFRLPRAEMGIIVPKNFDLILDDTGLYWTIHKIDILNYRNEFRCWCVRNQKQRGPVE